MRKRIISVILICLLIIGCGINSFAAAADVGVILCRKNFENGNNLTKPMVTEGEESFAEVVYDTSLNSNVLELTKKDSYLYVQQAVSYVPEILVFSADMKFSELGGSIYLFNFGKKRNITITSDRNIEAYSSDKVLFTPNLDTWYNFAIVFDSVEESYDFYVNYNKVNSEPISANMPDDGTIASWRLYTVSSDADTVWSIDNLSIYEGNAPHTQNELEEASLLLDRKSSYYDNSEIESRLQGLFALNTYTGFYFYNGSKNKLSAEIYEGDTSILLPAEEILGILNKEYTIAGQYIISDNVSYSCQKKNGILYLDSNVLFSEILKHQHIFKSDNLIVSGNTAFRGEKVSALAFETENYLTYERPEREQLRIDFEKTTQKGEHPRLLLKSEDVERMKQFIADGDEFMVKGYNKIISYSDYYAGKEIISYELSGGKLLGVSRDLLKRTHYMGAGYLLTGDEKYAEAVYKNLYAAASFPDWNHHTHYLDTGEMAAAFALGFDYTYDYIKENKSEEDIKLLRDAMKNFCLVPVRNTHYAGGIKYENNWNTVVNGGAVMCALLFCDEEGYEDIAFDIIEKSLKGLEYMMPSFAPEGGWEESSGYWSLMMRYLMRMMGSVESVLGTDYGVYDFKGLKNSGMFAFFVNGPTGLYNYHDASYSIPEWDTFMWMAQAFDNEAYAKLRYYNIDTYGNSPYLYDMIYYRGGYKKGENLPDIPKDGLIRGVELISLRSAYSKDALYVGAHGGLGDVPHWNLDSGTFVLDAMGERFASDLGGDNYGLDGYINTKSYLYYRKRTEGQNCVVINPDESMGQVYDAFSSVEEFVSTDGGGYAVINLTDAYSENAQSYKRGFKISDGRKTVTIRDEISLTAEENELYWFMHTEADVDMEGNKAVLTINDKRLLMEWEIEGGDSYEAKIMEAVPLPSSPNPDGQASNAAYKKIAFYIKGGGDVNITVRFTPEDDKALVGDFTPSSIEEWTLPVYPDYTVTDVKLSSSGGKISVDSFNVYSPYNTATPCKVLICVYDNEGLSDVLVKSSQLYFGENDFSSSYINEIQFDGTTNVKIFVLGNGVDILAKEDIL